MTLARAPNRNKQLENDYDHEHEQETHLHMIARIWQGWTKPEDAKTYENLLHDEIFPAIAARKIEGYCGAELFVSEDGDEVAFVTLLRFNSMDAVEEFAGPEATKPVIFPQAEALITRMEQARHYRVVI